MLGKYRTGDCQGANFPERANRRGALGAAGEIGRVVARLFIESGGDRTGTLDPANAEKPIGRRPNLSGGGRAGQKVIRPGRKARRRAGREARTISWGVRMAAYPGPLPGRRYRGVREVLHGGASTVVPPANRGEDGRGGSGSLCNTLVTAGGIGTERPHLPGVNRAGAQDELGRISTSGRSLRKAGRGARAGAEPLALIPVPGDAHPAERPLRGPGDPGSPAAAGGRGRDDGRSSIERSSSRIMPAGSAVRGNTGPICWMRPPSSA